MDTGYKYIFTVEENEGTTAVLKWKKKEFLLL